MLRNLTLDSFLMQPNEDKTEYTAILTNIKRCVILGPGEITRGQFSDERYHTPEVIKEYDQ